MSLGRCDLDLEFDGLATKRGPTLLAAAEAVEERVKTPILELRPNRGSEEDFLSGMAAARGESYRGPDLAIGKIPV